MMYSLRITYVARSDRCGDDTSFFRAIKLNMLRRYNWQIVNTKYRNTNQLDQTEKDAQAMKNGTWNHYDAYHIVSGWASTKKKAWKKATKEWEQQFGPEPNVYWIAREPKLRELTQEEIAYELIKEGEKVAQ